MIRDFSTIQIATPALYTAHVAFKPNALFRYLHANMSQRLYHNGRTAFQYPLCTTYERIPCLPGAADPFLSSALPTRSLGFPREVPGFCVLTCYTSRLRFWRMGLKQALLIFLTYGRKTGRRYAGEARVGGRGMLLDVWCLVYLLAARLVRFFASVRRPSTWMVDATCWWCFGRYVSNG